jgi:hypothetical protein
MVSQRTGIFSATIEKFESGSPNVPVSPKLIADLIADLGLTPAQFNTQEKLKDPTKDDSPDPLSDPAPRKRRASAPAAAAPVSVAAPKSEPAGKTTFSGLTVVNHTTSSFIIRLESGQIHILDDCKENFNKGNWIAPADEQAGGMKIVARATPLKQG